jgi:uncharacterized protein (UPF0254 family)
MQVSATISRYSSKVLPTLANIRAHLGIALAAAAVASLALKRQNAEGDADVALLLQRCVADEISRQIDRLDEILKTARVTGAEVRVSGGET